MKPGIIISLLFLSYIQADGSYLSANKIFLANAIRMFWKKNSENKVFDLNVFHL